MELLRPITDRNAVLLRHESEPAFAVHRDSYYQRFTPALGPETDLVDQMISVTWRIRRIAALESAALDHTIQSQRPVLDATYENLDPETRAHFAVEKLETESTALATYQRYQNSLIRQYDRAFRNLRLLQTQKNSRNEPNFHPTEPRA